jgi:hypothetical protein
MPLCTAVAAVRIDPDIPPDSVASGKRVEPPLSVGTAGIFATLGKV